MSLQTCFWYKVKFISITKKLLLDYSLPCSKFEDNVCSLYYNTYVEDWNNDFPVHSLCGTILELSVLGNGLKISVLAYTAG